MIDCPFLCSSSPRLIDMGKVYRQTNLENLEQAFSVAERDLGVTRLLDPEGKTIIIRLVCLYFLKLYSPFLCVMQLYNNNTNYKLLFIC